MKRVAMWGSRQSGTIYYLQTSTPHLYDVSVSGPFHVLDAVKPQITHNFGIECPSGQSGVQDLRSEDGQLMLFDFIGSPINGDASRVKKIRLITKRNPDMAAQLPGPAWSVMVAKVATSIMLNPPANRHGGAPLTDIEVRGTFDNEADATARAERVVQELVAGLPGGRADWRPSGEAYFVAGVTGEGDDGERNMKLVQVRYDAGTVVPP